MSTTACVTTTTPSTSTPIPCANGSSGLDWYAALNYTPGSNTGTGCPPDGIVVTLTGIAPTGGGSTANTSAYIVIAQSGAGFTTTQPTGSSWTVASMGTTACSTNTATVTTNCWNGPVSSSTGIQATPQSASTLFVVVNEVSAGSLVVNVVQTAANMTTYVPNQTPGSTLLTVYLPTTSTSPWTQGVQSVTFSSLPSAQSTALLVTSTLSGAITSNNGCNAASAAQSAVIPIRNPNDTQLNFTIVPNTAVANSTSLGNCTTLPTIVFSGRSGDIMSLQFTSATSLRYWYGSTGVSGNPLPAGNTTGTIQSTPVTWTTPTIPLFSGTTQAANQPMFATLTSAGLTLGLGTSSTIVANRLATIAIAQSTQSMITGAYTPALGTGVTAYLASLGGTSTVPPDVSSFWSRYWWTIVLGVIAVVIVGIGIYWLITQSSKPETDRGSAYMYAVSSETPV